MSYYLLSTIDWDKGIDKLLEAELVKDITKRKKILLFPTDYINTSITEKYFNYIIKTFNDISITFNEYVLVSKIMSSEEITKHIETSDVIFLMGGDTLNQMNFILDKSLKEPLRAFNGVMIGMSAGALNMCKRGILLNEHPDERVHIYEGIGVVDTVIEVHYDILDNNQNKLVQESLKVINEINCITDNGFIIVKDKLETFGDVRVVKSKLPSIETERLLLRHWKETDLDDLYEYAHNDLVGPSAGWPVHKSKEDSKKVLTRFLEGNQELAVVLKSEQKVIGGIGIHFRTPDENKVLLNQREVGYVLNPNYWGNGYIPEAVNAIKDLTFNKLDIDLLWCGHYDFNHNSRRVNEKCGFNYKFTVDKLLPKLDNEIVKTLYYSISKDEFLRNK